MYNDHNEVVVQITMTRGEYLFLIEMFRTNWPESTKNLTDNELIQAAVDSWLDDNCKSFRSRLNFVDFQEKMNGHYPLAEHGDYLYHPDGNGKRYEVFDYGDRRYYKRIS